MPSKPSNNSRTKTADKPEAKKFKGQNKLGRYGVCRKTGTESKSNIEKHVEFTSTDLITMGRKTPVAYAIGNGFVEISTIKPFSGVVDRQALPKLVEYQSTYSVTIEKGDKRYDKARKAAYRQGIETSAKRMNECKERGDIKDFNYWSDVNERWKRNMDNEYPERKKTSDAATKKKRKVA